jgi:YlmC/YmxH family sporulation protein
MRLSELSGKEIVNLTDGARLGIIGDTDLVIDEETGEIVKLLIPNTRGISILGDRSFVEIPWDSIKKIGPELVIIEHSPRNTNKRFL